MKRILNLLFVCFCCLPGYGTVVPDIDYVRTNMDKYSYKLDDAMERISKKWENSNKPPIETLLEYASCLKTVAEAMGYGENTSNENSCFSDDDDLSLDDVWNCGIAKLHRIILKCMSDDSDKANALYKQILDVLDGPRERC